MLKKIFINEELLIYLFLMFMFSIISLIRYYVADIVENYEIKEISVILSSKPQYYSGGEYSDPELSFDVEGYSGTFKISGYEHAYNLFYQSGIQNLKFGDSLKLIVSKQIQKSENNDIEVYGIEDSNHSKLLTLDEHNHHKKNEWKDIWFIVLFFNLFFWPMKIRRWVKLIKAAKKG
jgi:hypothetical protein